MKDEWKVERVIARPYIGKKAVSSGVQPIEGMTEAIHSESSVQGMEQTIEKTGSDFDGLCFVNLSQTRGCYRKQILLE